jgi:hypothetical protein
VGITACYVTEVAVLSCALVPTSGTGNDTCKPEKVAGRGETEDLCRGRTRDGTLLVKVVLGVVGSPDRRLARVGTVAVAVSLTYGKNKTTVQRTAGATSTMVGLSH